MSYPPDPLDTRDELLDEDGEPLKLNVGSTSVKDYGKSIQELIEKTLNDVREYERSWCAKWLREL